jgi:hypothetical protein
VIILDENIIDSQRQLLLGWRIHVRQVGYEIGRKGLKDDELIPLLLQLRRPTLFSRDRDFSKRQLSHPGYCLIQLAVRQGEVATYVRRLLRHPDFNTQAKRMGTVIRASPIGLTVWRLHVDTESYVSWL